MLVALQWLVRGALIILAHSLAKGQNFYYRDDAYDNNAFCRYNKL
jgi:hypothetical protein